MVWFIALKQRGQFLRLKALVEFLLSGALCSQAMHVWLLERVARWFTGKGSDVRRVRHAHETVLVQVYASGAVHGSFGSPASCEGCAA